MMTRTRAADATRDALMGGDLRVPMLWAERRQADE
jgi:hypothetical protein